MNECKGLLAADLLQNQPDHLLRSTADCASPAWALSPGQIRPCRLSRNNPGFSGKLR